MLLPSKPTLLELGRWVLRINQWIGYCSLQINVQGDLKALQFRILSFQTFNTILIVILQVIFTVIFIRQGFIKNALAQLNVSRQTEVSAMLFCGILTTFVPLVQRILSIIRYKKELKFLLKVQDNFECIWNSNNAHVSHHFRSLLRKTGKEIDFTLIFDSLLILTYILYFTARLAMVNARRSIGPQATYIAWQSFFVALSFHFNFAIHNFYTSWLIFPLKIIQSSLIMLRIEVKRSTISAQCFKLCQSRKMTSPHHCRSHSSEHVNYLISNPISQVGHFQGQVGVDESLLRNCIENYYRISHLVKLYSKTQGSQLILQFGYNTMIILGYSFMTTSWAIQGMIGSAFSRVPGVLLSIRTLYILTTEAEQLGVLQNRLLVELCRVPKHLLSLETQLKVSSLVQEMASDKFTISPGFFYKMNRRLLTSIASTILTFLIVLVQFRHGEDISVTASPFIRINNNTVIQTPRPHLY